MADTLVSGAPAAITDTTSTQVIAAPAAGNRILVTSLCITNAHATQGTVVTILSGSTVKWRVYCAPVGGGFADTFAMPLACAAAEALNAQCVTTGASVLVNAIGYTAPA
jgi:hypothetical protein